MKILEEFKTHGYSILLIKYEDRNKTNLKIEQAIEHILSDYKRVLQENEKLKAKLLDTLEGQKVIKEETPQYIKENYISKQKVKDKIKELSEIKGDFATCIATNERIKALSELLESEV